MATHRPFIYHNISVVRIVDGDTIRLRIDAGFRFAYEDNFRLEGIDTPERGQEGFAESRDRLQKWVTEKNFSVQVTKRDKYGRYLARLICKETNEDAATTMIVEGFGTEYYGGKRTT